MGNSATSDIVINILHHAMLIISDNEHTVSLILYSFPWFFFGMHHLHMYIEC